MGTAALPSDRYKRNTVAFLALAVAFALGALGGLAAGYAVGYSLCERTQHRD
jgi:hypothetical protein